MSRMTGWRTFVAVPAVVAIALGSALLVAVPASAESIPAPVVEAAPIVVTEAAPSVEPESALPAESEAAPSAAVAAAPGVAILTPADGASLESHVQVFAGTAPVGATITAVLNAKAAANPLVLGTTTAGASGEFSIEVSFDYSRVGSQSITFTGSLDGVEFAPAVRAFVVLPISAPVVDEQSLFPDGGFFDDSETVTVSGTGVAGQLVVVTFPPLGFYDTPPGYDTSVPVPSIETEVSALGGWSVTADLDPGFYYIAAQHAQRLPSTGELVETSPSSFPLQALSFVVAFPTPVVSGATVDAGGTVRVSGTANPGAYVQASLTSARVHDATDAFWNDYEFDQSDFLIAPPTPADAAGNWAVDIALPKTGSYYAGALIVDLRTEYALSAYSNEVRFTYAATVRPVQLAATGVDTTGQIGLGSALLVGGLLLLAARRRRTAL